MQHLRALALFALAVAPSACRSPEARRTPAPAPSVESPAPRRGDPEPNVGPTLNPALIANVRRQVEQGVAVPSVPPSPQPPSLPTQVIAPSDASAGPH